MAYVVNYKPYSKAFFNFVSLNNALDNVYADATLVEKAIEANTKLKIFIQDRYINSKEKLALLKSVFSNLSSETQQLLKVLSDNRRLAYIQNILSEFINLYYKEKKITKVNITFASQIDKNIIDNLKNKIADNLKNKVLANINVNEALIGGFIIYFDSKTYNASIANRLNLIKTKLLENS